MTSPGDSPAVSDTRPSGGVALEPGALILGGRFRVERLLGGGGMGLVYMAEQVSLGRKVAVKVLRHDLPPLPGATERFKREALLLSSVEHPAVIRVIDFGQEGLAACIVMEFVEGQSLEQVLVREAPLSVERVERLLVQLAQGLSAIHAKGIIHRDLKPENVVLTQGPDGAEQARLLDFGIARLAETEAAASVTQVGTVLGTPEYLAPEQAMGLALDARTDLYSLGVVAYRMLTGKHPFTGPTPQQFVAQHVHELPKPLVEAAPMLASFPALTGAVMACLEKSPAHRPPTAQAFVERVQAPLTPNVSGLLTTILPTVASSPKAAAPRRSSWKLKVGLALGFLALVAAAGVVGYLDPQRVARRLVQAGRGPEALQVIDDAGEKGKAPGMQLLRAAAYHQVGRHEEEWKLLEASIAPDDLEDDALFGLVDDFGRGEPARLKKALAGLPKSKVVPVLQRLAKGEQSWAQWGALRYLDAELAGQGLPLAELYIRALESRDCKIRAIAARRLSELRNPAAVEPLQRLKALPKKKGLVVDEECGQDAAAAALNKLERELNP